MKPTNEDVVRYRRIEAEVRRLEEQREALRDRFIRQGSFSTKGFNVNVQEYEQDRMCGLPEAEEILGKEVAQRCARTSKFVRVSVVPKRERVAA